MARQCILLKTNREAHLIEGNLDSGSAPKPGQHVSLKSSGEYELWNGSADGEQGETVLVTEDALLGKMVTDAYAVSSRFYGYIPLAGDEVQVLVASGENIAIGDKLIIDDGTGKCIETTGTPEQEVYRALESTGGALAADGLVLVRKL